MYAVIVFEICPLGDVAPFLSNEMIYFVAAG